MDNFVKLVKNGLFVWTAITSAIIGGIGFYSEYKDWLVKHPVEIGLLTLILITTSITTYSIRVKHASTKDSITQLHSKFDEGLNSLQRQILRSDIDRFHEVHFNDEYLTEDEAEYVYMLRDKLEVHNVNGFSKRKVSHLLTKPIRPVVK